MANSGGGSDDFESTVPINLSKLDPYEKKNDVDSSLEHDVISDIDFVDLDAALDAIDSRLETFDEVGLDSLNVETAIEPYTATHDPMEDREDIKTQPMKVDITKPVEPIQKKGKSLPATKKTLATPKQNIPAQKKPDSTLRTKAPQANSLKRAEVKISEAPRKNVLKVDSSKLAATPETRSVPKVTPPVKVEKPKQKHVMEKLDAKVDKQDKSEKFKEKKVDAQTVKDPEKPQVKQQQGLSMLVGCLALVVGGAGIWMVLDANEQVRVLQQKLQNIEVKIHRLNIEYQQSKMKNTHAAVGVHAAQVKKKKVQLAVTSLVKDDAPQTIEIKKVISPKTPVSQVNVPDKNGDWVVNVSSDKIRALANKMRDKLAKSGVDSVVTPTKIKGSVWYRVQILGFETRQDAKHYVDKFQQKQHIEGVWIGKR